MWDKRSAGGGTLATNEAIAILKNHLRLAPVRNTRLAEISFTSSDPNEAAKIANAVAGAYQEYRLEKRKQDIMKRIQELTDDYRAEEQAINTRQEQLDQLKRELNVPDSEPTEEC